MMTMFSLAPSVEGLFVKENLTLPNVIYWNFFSENWAPFQILRNVRQTHFLLIYIFIMILFCKDSFINMHWTNYKRSHREMFLTQLSQQNVRNTPAKEFYYGCFSALVTPFETTDMFFSVFVYHIYKKHT